MTGYRVLELGGQESLFAGKLLADLGATVIKVEPPDGDPARLLGPLAPGVAAPEASLLWQSLNTGKQGVTLDLGRRQGRELFLRLAVTADVVIEGPGPGGLAELGLGYETLCQARPELILVSITPFGDSGPYRDYAADDLVIWALSGLLYICGDPDRPPVRISLPQCWLHAGADAATGAALALFHRGRTGRGQRVVVSAMRSLERAAYSSRILWDAMGKVMRRQGGGLPIQPLGTTLPIVWPCADGHVVFYIFGGQMGMISNPALAAWMDEEGLAPEEMKSLDWPSLDLGRMPQEEADRRLVEPVAAFFARHTQAELWEQGVRRRVMVYPINDAAGVLADAHLAQRGFWVKMAHPAHAQELTLPGPFVRTEEGLCRVRGPAPTLGRHNGEVYAALGLDQAGLAAMGREGVI
ncbi:CoA transferase [Desulfoferula mesophila]|uniref:CoA transferase n=1 Tax=Desulfoferula mesophila TaxID=3058419 RepID=A0AAU9F2A6_9BACT|nr:CoA transferase [Desulfoferula mesophilus]